MIGCVPDRSMDGRCPLRDSSRHGRLTPRRAGVPQRLDGTSNAHAYRFRFFPCVRGIVSPGANRSSRMVATNTTDTSLHARVPPPNMNHIMNLGRTVITAKRQSGQTTRPRGGHAGHLDTATNHSRCTPHLHGDPRSRTPTRCGPRRAGPRCSPEARRPGWPGPG